MGLNWSPPQCWRMLRADIKLKTRKMVQWRSINQWEVDGLVKELSGTLEEEVWDKYTAEETKKVVHKGRGEPLEWRKSSQKRR